VSGIPARDSVVYTTGEHESVEVLTLQATMRWRVSARPTAPNDRPLVVVIAGPNGAGKSTTARRLLQGALAVTEFVNADAIAAGLSAFRPESVALAAGRIMLMRLKHLASTRTNFAFETTLAAREYARWLRSLRAEGYRTHLVFLSLPSPELAVARVAERVRRGGHAVPEAVIRRRYAAGLRNFFALYRDVVESWQLYDNSDLRRLNLVAAHADETSVLVHDHASWDNLLRRQQ
jgi:predicted ABC-type ATPase